MSSRGRARGCALLALAHVVACVPAAVAMAEPAARPVRAYDVQVGFRVGWAQLLDQQQTEVAVGNGMIFDMAWRPATFLAVGGELGYYRYGWSDHRDPVLPRYSRKNDIVPLVFTMRLQPSFGLVRPYVQGVAGLTIFKTTVDFQAVTGDEDDVIDSFAPVALCAGAEVGLDVVLERKRYHDPAHDATVLLTMGVRRSWNTRATFGLPGPLSAGSRTGPTAWHQVMVGLSLRADRR